MLGRLCLLLLAVVVFGTPISASDADVLLEIASLSNNTLSGWLPNNTANLCVDWEGVICYGGRVALLLLNATGASDGVILGRLPDSIKLLDGLVILNLENNFIYGELPSEILSSPKLISLSMDTTGLQLTMPAVMGRNITKIRMAHALILNKKLPEVDFSRVLEYYFEGATIACPLPPAMVSFLNSGGIIPNCRTHFTQLYIDDNDLVCGQVHISRYTCSITPMGFIPPFLAETAEVPTNFTAKFGNFTVEFFNDEISIFAAYTDRHGARRNYRREYASFKMQPIAESYGEPHFGYTRTYAKPKWTSFVLGDKFVLANMTNTDGLVHEYKFDYMTNKDHPYLKLSGAVYNLNHTWIDSPNYDAVRRVTVSFAFNFRVAHSPVLGIPLTCGRGQLFNSRCSSSAAELTSNLDFFTGEYVVEAKTSSVEMAFRFLPAGFLDGEPLTFNNAQLFVNRIPAPFPDGTWLERATAAGYTPNVTSTPEEIQALSAPIGISIPRFDRVFAFDPDVSITLLFNPNDNLPPETATPSELQLQSSLSIGAVVAGVVVAVVVIIAGVTVFAFVVFPYLKARKQAELVRNANGAEELNDSTQIERSSAKWTTVRPNTKS